MKKHLFIAAMTLLVSSVVVAQPRAIGGRLGCGLEVSYEHSLGQNMVSVDAGIPGLTANFVGFEAAATYDWINPFGANFENLWEGKGMWNWYMGVGGALGAYRQSHYVNQSYDNWTVHHFFGVAGRVGVEYNFWFPLQLSVDWRPVIGPSFQRDYAHNDLGQVYSRATYTNFNSYGLFLGGICLGVRYKF